MIKFEISSYRNKEITRHTVALTVTYTENQNNVDIGFENSHRRRQYLVCVQKRESVYSKHLSVGHQL